MSMSITRVRSDDSVMFRNVSGAFCAALLASLNTPDDENTPYLTGIEAQVKNTDTDDWTMSLYFGPSSTEVLFSDIEVGTEYNLRVRPIYSNGVVAPWASSWGDPVETSHVVQGNLQLPPTLTSIAVVATTADSLRFSFVADFIPTDFAGYELRYYLGAESDFPAGVYDWDDMSVFGIVNQSPFEISEFASGHYTFAAKMLNVAVDPHEDATATPPTPKTANESADAAFVEFDVVDPRPVRIEFSGATTPTAISAVAADVSGYAGSEQSANATLLGITHDASAGTVTFPAMTSQIQFRVIAQVNLDTTVSGSPANDTDVGLLIRGSISGDVYAGGGYIVDKNKQTVLPLNTVAGVIASSEEVFKIGLITSAGGSGNISIINSLVIFEKI